MPRYIDAEAFEKDIRKRYCKQCKRCERDYHGIKCFACEIDNMLGEVANAPTADVQEVKHGCWEYHGNEITRYCSVCGESIPNGFEFYYCPNCGAENGWDCKIVNE